MDGGLREMKGTVSKLRQDPLGSDYVIAHDTILRKLDSDPEWYLELLKSAQSSIAPASYAK